jgi:hypothetical protein
LLATPFYGQSDREDASHTHSGKIQTCITLIRIRTLTYRAIVPKVVVTVLNWQPHRMRAVGYLLEDPSFASAATVQ